MTRFWLTLEQAARFVIKCIDQMQGGEVFVPKIPSMSIMDLVRTVAPDSEINEIGIRPGEKLHEVLISTDEARQTVELEDMFVVQPAHSWWSDGNWREGKPLPDGFSYSSDTNDCWLTVEDLHKLIEEVA
jgi:UDP-N-acetylglucosamine 4,6-dehydratase